MNKVLLKPEKEVVESPQRKASFLTTCKVEGKCCKVVIDNESTDNLVSTEMVKKLKLRKFKHPTPFFFTPFVFGYHNISSHCYLSLDIIT